jgi:hypothetical protein
VTPLHVFVATTSYESKGNEKQSHINSQELSLQCFHSMITSNHHQIQPDPGPEVLLDDFLLVPIPELLMDVL